MGIAALAGGGALAGFLNARSANKPKTQTQSGTATSTPYMNPELQGRIPGVLDMFQQAATSDRASTARTGQAPGGGGYSRQPGPRGQLVPDPSVPAGMERRPDGRLVPMGGAPGRGGRGGGGGGGGLQPMAAPAGAPQSPDTAAQDIFQQAANQGLNFGNTDLANLGSQFVGDVLTNPGSTGFGGRNPAASSLFNQASTADLGRARSYLDDFLGGGAQPSQPTPRPSYVGGGGGGYGGGGGGSYGGGGSAGGNVLPPMSEMQTNREGLFDTQLQNLFNSGAADEEIQAVIDSLTSDLSRGLMGSVADIQARGTGQGRATSDIIGDTDLAREGMMRSLASQSGQVRLEDLFNRRSNTLGGLGLLNNRNIAGEGANVGRANALTAADASRANAATGAGAANFAAQLAADTARRGQNLQAAQSLAGLEQFGLGAMGDLAGLRQGEMGLGLEGLQGLQGLNLGGINAATGAGQGMAGLAGLDTQQQIANSNNALGRYGIDTQNQQFGQQFGQQQLNDYLRAIGMIGGMGGTTTQNGTVTMPGAGVNPWAAGILGGIGGASTGAGMAGMYGG